MTLTDYRENDAVYRIESLLRKVSSTVRRQGRAILGDFDITSAQFDALVLANDGGNLTIGDLSAKLGLAYSTTTDLVDRLERRNFVERSRDQEDKRVVRLSVLEEGGALIDRVLQARRVYLGRVLSHSGADEQDMLMRALMVLEQHLGEE